MSEIETLAEQGSTVGEVPAASAADRRDADLAAMCLQARADFGLHCFWNVPVLPGPADDARLVAERLRRYGGRRGWMMAVAIDGILREAVGASDGVDRISAHGASLPRP